MSDTKYQGDATPVVDPLDKGLGALDAACAPEQIAAQGWNVLKEDLSLPAAVLSQSRIEHNLAWMQRFVNEYGAKLAPHGKTTMAPRLFQHQLAGGAWGITLATAHQTRAAYAHGVRRVLMANQLVGKRNMAILAELLADPSFEFFCLVDAADQVEQLATFFGKAGRPIQVLIELGVQGGRTGVRDDAQLQSVLDALTRANGGVKLAGVEVYEGVIKEEADIRAFLQRAVKTLGDLARAGRLQRTPAVLTGAGSAWYDVVAEEFAKADIGQPLDVVLRPGCYLTHDVGIYKAAQARIDANNPIAHKMRSSLLPALQLWAYVQSVPEPGRAIIAMGKRDAAFDAGLPLPVLHYRPGRDDASLAPSATPAHWEVTGMMDQHAYLKIAAGDDIKVGDMIAFDISHPCLTFDKWRQISVVDDAYNVVDVVQTYF
ncbi:amino acid deaminase [Ralstonia mannitolilytica]|uniref:D-threonine aldolase n=1 Tax=Ralstonia mannitolilytica TaxID=105219 RepID=A0AAJ5D6G1_9RALS|nr:amino acid deaminase [Ralstonia mannitolilytica]CAG2129193.1 D-threonine aldolase [Ralstonia mannitolilytica]CAJ0736120.1 D-threonine aldolase [Ralstonia mannitolilytica]SUE24375.1 D-threonine aldolase [Ralstonia mannitolilytica]SUE25719.1 D-threonine aldolase [Ralstonia mannitolilytica]SUE35528.1 D-threonine aldolase [Ralstonia mannitolilytica]